MKNIIILDSDGEKLVAATNDGTNSLTINDTLISPNDYTGTGNYTATIAGHSITIAKVQDGSGNIQLVRISQFNYALKKAPQNPVQTMIDTVYPVGSYYETSDNTFDPNVVWGGAWNSTTSNNIYKWHRTS